jgi:RNA polymerase sigma-70 factor (ECF subfamily)
VTLLWQRRGVPVEHEAAARDAACWSSLARRIEQGDREAEAEIAALFHRRVRLLAAVRLHGSDTARDIAQETILAVLQALRAGQVREPDRLPAFVLGIARNLINNHHRTQARSVEVPGDPPEEPAAAEPDLAHLDDERRARVRAALIHLNQLDRRILLLTLVDGLHPREIAPLVHLTPEVVRTRKARAVKAIGEQIKRNDTKPAARLHR